MLKNLSSTWNYWGKEKIGGYKNERWESFRVNWILYLWFVFYEKGNYKCVKSNKRILIIFGHEEALLRFLQTIQILIYFSILSYHHLNVVQAGVKLVPKMSSCSFYFLYLCIRCFQHDLFIVFSDFKTMCKTISNCTIFDINSWIIVEHTSII